MPYFWQMSYPFFYESFESSHEIFCSDATTHHITQVLRMQEGEKIFFTNGKGLKCLAEISGIQKKSFQFSVLSEELAPVTQPQLSIAISFTKNAARIEWLVEKLTEMGIYSIVPLVTKRSERHHIKTERLEKIIIAAMLQSQQTYLPVLKTNHTIEELITLDDTEKYIAHCEVTKQRVSLLDALTPNKNATILIGPEGDFTEDEIHLCLQANFQAVSLGTNRLRTETAGLFACAVFNAKQNRT